MFIGTKWIEPASTLASISRSSVATPVSSMGLAIYHISRRAASFRYTAEFAQAAPRPARCFLLRKRRLR